MKSWRLFYIFSIDKAGIETKTGIISGKFSSLPGDCKTFPTIFTQQHCMDFSLWARHLHLKMETYRKALEVISPTWKFEKPRPADSPPRLIKSTALCYTHSHHGYFGKSHKFEKHILKWIDTKGKDASALLEEVFERQDRVMEEPGRNLVNTRKRRMKEDWRSHLTHTTSSRQRHMMQSTSSFQRSSRPPHTLPEGFLCMELHWMDF